MPSCDSNIRFVYFRAKGARARVHFPATYFLYFVPVCSNSFLVFCEYHERKKTLKRKNVQLSESMSMFTSIYRLISRNNWWKNGKIRVFGGEMVIEKWRFWRLKRRGRLIVLNKAAKIVWKRLDTKETTQRDSSLKSKWAMSREVSRKAKVRGPWDGNKTSA